MISDSVKEKIFADRRTWKVPFEYQSVMLRVIEDILEEMGVNLDDAVSESEYISMKQCPGLLPRMKHKRITLRLF